MYANALHIMKCIVNRFWGKLVCLSCNIICIHQEGYNNFEVPSKNSQQYFVNQNY